VTDIPGIDYETTANYGASGIGLGYKNSLAIVAQGNDTTTAGGAARAYAGGSKSDWYLPTTAELNQLCLWSRGITPSVSTVCTGNSHNSAAGFVLGAYWSSSEYSASWMWYQQFNNGTITNEEKKYTHYVRPVRSF
jgi:hypothetical protein